MKILRPIVNEICAIFYKQVKPYEFFYSVRLHKNNASLMLMYRGHAEPKAWQHIFNHTYCVEPWMALRIRMTLCTLNQGFKNDVQIYVRTLKLAYTIKRDMRKKLAKKTLLAIKVWVERFVFFFFEIYYRYYDI